MSGDLMELSADVLDFAEIDHFSRGEFPDGVLERVEDELILSLNEYRSRLGYPLVPSPLVAGWYREDGSVTSRHYAVDRLSDAGDLFPQCDIRRAFLVAMGCEWFGGIGVYLDTNGPDGEPQPMIHLDLRPGQTIWMRYEGRYIYPLRSDAEQAEFFKLLSEAAS